MFTFFKNRISKSLVMLCFVTALVLMPVSPVFTPSPEGALSVSVSINKAHAFPWLLIGALGAFGSSYAADFAPSKWLLTFVGNLVLNIASALMWLGGLLLEKSLEYFVFDMGKMLQGNLGITITTMWSLVRDICNLVFIFGLIYIGLRTIIDPENSSTKKTLTQIIIAAFLINFSLFIVKVVIDFSNFLAFTLFKSLTDGSGSISAAFGHALGLISFFNVTGGEQLDQITNGGYLWYFFITAIFILVAAFVFIASALMLIVRFVALVFIMIFSPILFAGTIFPQTQSLVSDLWHKLFGYAFFAPAYVLLTLISLQILGSLGLGGENGSFVTALASPNGNDSFDVIFKFVVSIGFMIGSLLVAQKMGVKGGALAVGVGNNLRGRVQSFAGRTTIGRGAHWAREKYEEYDARAQKSPRTRAKLFKTVQKAAALVGIDDRAIKGTLEAGEHTKFGGSYSYEDDHEYHEKHKARQASTNKLLAFKKTTSEGVDANGNILPFANTNAKIAFERAIADATIKEFEELTQVQRTAIAGMLTQSQIDSIDKSEKLTDSEKDQIYTARKAAFGQIYVANRELLSKASSDNLLALGETYLSDAQNAVQLTSSQMDDLKKKLTPTEYTQLSTSRENALLSLAVVGGSIPTTIGGVATNLDYSFISKQKPGEIAKMPSKVLIRLSENAQTQLSIAALSKIAQDGTLSAQDQATIRGNIVTQLSGGGLTQARIQEFTDWFGTPQARTFGT